MSGSGSRTSGSGVYGSRLGLAAAAFDGMPGQCAVIDPLGTVLVVNRAWRRFGEDNGADARCGVGANYLAVTERAAATGDPFAGAVLAALTAVLEAHAPRASVSYPCHSPTEQRWFRVHAMPLPGRRDVLIVHDDVTEEVHGQVRVQSQRVRPAALPVPRSGRPVPPA